MTNWNVLTNPILARGNAADPAYLREMAEETWPGAEYRVLLNNFSSSSTTAATVTDGTAANKDLSITLRANEKYYIRFFGSYNREDTNDVRVDIRFSGTHTGQPETAGWRRYHLSGTGEFTDSLVDILGTSMVCTSSVGNGFSFEQEGWVNVTGEGELTMRFRQETASGVAATLYAGTMLIAQPIINLTDRSNP